MVGFSAIPGPMEGIPQFLGTDGLEIRPVAAFLECKKIAVFWPIESGGVPLMVSNAQKRMFDVLTII